MFGRLSYENQPELTEKFRRKLISYKEPGGMFAAAIAAFERNDLSDQISRIKIPTLVIAGSEDISATAQEAEFMASRIENAQLQIFEEANHLLAVEKPIETAECISTFLRTVSSQH